MKMQRMRNVEREKRYVEELGMKEKIANELRIHTILKQKNKNSQVKRFFDYALFFCTDETPSCVLQTVFTSNQIEGLNLGGNLSENPIFNICIYNFNTTMYSIYPNFRYLVDYTFLILFVSTEFFAKCRRDPGAYQFDSSHDLHVR
jgi:hypothetical protein